MKKLISTLVVAGAVLGLSAVSFGQQAGAKGGQQGRAKAGGRQGGGPGGGRMARMGKMQEEILAKLNLTADQKKKVEAHNKKMAEKMKAAFEKMGPGGDREAMRKQFMGLRDESDKGMKAILTADQWKKFETARKEAREKMRKQFGGGQGGPGARRGGAGGPGAAGGGGAKAGGGN